MLEINTSELKGRVKVKIDGHEYTVRKLGAGEELALSQLLREADVLAKKEEKSQKDKSLSITEDEQKRGIEMMEQYFDTMVGLFDDGGDQSKSRQLLDGLSTDEQKEVYEMIFPPTKNNNEASQSAQETTS